MAQSITKYAVQVTEPEDIRYELEKAFFLSMSGRPGPVLLDIPMNIQRQDVQSDKLKRFETKDDHSQVPLDLSSVFKALQTANRPCMLVGAGVKSCGMVQEFRKLVSKLGIPVVSSMLAVDVLPSDFENYYGFIGAYGDRKANFVIAKCDLILSIGSRLDCRQIGTAKEKFAPQAKLIRFDIDEGELTNVVKPDEQQIVADLRMVIPQLCEHVDAELKQQFSGWIDVCNEITTRLVNLDLEEPNRIIKELSRIIPDNMVITTDVGQNQVWLAQSFELKKNQQMLFSGGHGAMGYSLPAAIGACYGSGKKVISFSGDGGIQMNIQELQFVSREKLPIKIVILNNSSLGMIRHFQEMYFDSHYMQTIKENGYTVPSFEKIAAAYELPYYRIEKMDDNHATLFKDDGPAVIEVILPQTTWVFPKLAMNKPNQDQEPPIDRRIYDYLMKL
jgi:acetolactate synthase-1/2/3 large subunit